MNAIENPVAVAWGEVGHETSRSALAGLWPEEQPALGDCFCTISPDPLRLPWDDTQ